MFASRNDGSGDCPTLLRELSIVFRTGAFQDNQGHANASESEYLSLVNPLPNGTLPPPAPVGKLASPVNGATISAGELSGRLYIDVNYVSRDGTDVRYGDKALRYSGDLPDTPDLQLMIRPERVLLSEDGPVEGANNFSATASDVVYQGDSFLLHARLQDGQQIVMRGAVRGNRATSLPAVGDQVTLTMATDDTVLIDGREV